MYTYFQESMTLEEAKAHYKNLVRQHHPDAGGDTRTMQDINAEWAKFQANYARHDARQRQEKAHAEGRKSAGDFHDLDEVAEALRIKIEFALNLEGVEVELMGLWVWLTGNTKTHKDAIKEQGFKWAPEKTAWFYAGVPSMNRQRRTLDEIRSMHGSQKFSRSQRQEQEETAGVLHA